MMIPTTRLGYPGIDLIGDITHQNEVLDVLKKNGFVLCSPEKAEAMRIEAGIPQVGIDVTEENLPQEGKLDLALHFTKGCYLGQEIIARLHYKGHVNKILCHFKMEKSETIPQQGDLLFSQDKEVGKLTSVAQATDHSGFFMLGYLSSKAYDNKMPVMLGSKIIRLLNA